MTEIYLHFLFAHYGLYGNAPVRSVVALQVADAGALSILPRDWRVETHCRSQIQGATVAAVDQLRVRGHIIGHARNNM